MSFKTKAIFSLYPNVANLIGEQDAYDKDGNKIELNETSINNEVARLQAEYDAKEYARNRAKEYPSLAGFADAYYWAQNGDDTKMTAYIEKCAEVKQKYPKS